MSFICGTFYIHDIMQKMYWKSLYKKHQCTHDVLTISDEAYDITLLEKNTYWLTADAIAKKKIEE